MIRVDSLTIIMQLPFKYLIDIAPATWLAVFKENPSPYSFLCSIQTLLAKSGDVTVSVHVD